MATGDDKGHRERQGPIKPNHPGSDREKFYDRSSPPNVNQHYEPAPIPKPRPRPEPPIDDGGKK